MNNGQSNSTKDIAAWNNVADKYASLIGTPDDKVTRLFHDVLWASLGDLRGQTALDVGCGHGWLAAAMYEAGATVYGVDGAAKLLEIARLRCPQATFHEHDLTKGLPAFDRQFDRIVANMVLMDLPRLDALLLDVRAALRDSNSRFIFTMTHPCFFKQLAHQDEDGQMYCKVTGYLQAETRWIENFGGHRHYHRSLTTYFDCLRRSRLAVTRLFEPPQMPYSEEITDFRQKIPKFLLIEAMPY
ncbi:MAG: class I SAM-dependent methyltransferase [Chloroflexota bacterium]